MAMRTVIRKLRARYPHTLQAVMIFLLFLIIGTLAVLEMFSRGAAAIFNKAMTEQDMLRGTITVQKISATLTGHVFFNGLLWIDPDGHTLLEVPSGSFTVRPWDIVTNNIKSTTIQELTLNNAEISIHLADDMNVEFVRQSRDLNRIKTEQQEDSDWRSKVSLVGKSEEERKAIGEWRRRRNAEEITRDWKNFNRQNKKIRLNLNFNNCRMEVFHKKRHYLMDRVNLTADINTSEKMSINLQTGGFGGTMIGNSISLTGNVDFQEEEMPVCDMWLTFSEVDPSSLGFGLNVHDRMTLTTHLTGPLAKISGDGIVQMRELHIPGLQFANVTGNIFYDGAGLTFKDVKASVFGGTLEAEGNYDLDTRYYELTGHGENLQAAKALPGSSLSCSVNLDLSIQSHGNPQETTIYGAFESGAGHYKIIPFKRLAGRFQNEYHDLSFSAVAIEMSGFTVTTDAFRIKDGKLTLNPLQFTFPSGQPALTFMPPEN